jgi:hypothetical protein
MANMSSKVRIPTEEEIDDTVEAQASDDSAWEKPVRVRKSKSSAISLPSELAARATFPARLRNQARVQERQHLMSLTDLWQNSRDQLLNKQLHQIIAFAGEGKLRDGSVASTEFREFLSHVSSDVLCSYAEDCLSNTFPDSGLALQDIVNQVGQRLNFQVDDGRYQGSKGNIGYDGLWRFPSGHSVVVEVKTTDAYRIDSNKIAEYRKKLITVGKIEEEHSSILIVVGRQDTGDLEAQIRGSRNAWDIRLISVDALLRLMLLKEAVDDPAIIRRIGDILIPREFTRLDSIVEIVFSTTEEAKQETELAEVEPVETDLEPQGRTNEGARPVAFHDACVERFAKQQGIILVKRSRTSYTTPDNKIYVVCLVSKVHKRQNHTAYWFGFHPYQKDFLGKAAISFLVLGCGSQKDVLAIPFSDLRNWLDDLWITERNDTMYWHLNFIVEKGKLYLDRKKGKGRLDVTHYRLPNQTLEQSR